MNPQLIVTVLEKTIGVDGAPVRLRDAIEDTLSNHGSLPAIRAAERAEQLVVRVRQIIADRSRNHELGGTISTLTIIGTAYDVVVGSCRVLPTDRAEVAQAKTNRLRVQELLDAIRDLLFTDFERFGARVLTELGAQQVRVTPQSNDQGIDFYGVLNFGALQGNPPPFFSLSRDVELRFAGQAKHYPK